jgi:hypothetical protein
MAHQSGLPKGLYVLPLSELILEALTNDETGDWHTPGYTVTIAVIPS